MKPSNFEAISHVADTILIARADGQITYLNEAGLKCFEQVLGQQLKTVVGSEIAEIILFQHPPRQWKGEVSLKKADGSAFDAFLSSTPVVENGKLTSVVAIIQDITREKAAREALVQSERMITLGELVAGTSHELNNPLAIITGYADLLLEDRHLNSDQRSKVQSIRRNAMRASTVVHSLLAFARKRKPERVATDVNCAIEAAMELKEYDLRASGIRLEKDLAPDLPGVFADPYQLQQVLLNVLNNAQDAVSQGPSPRISVKTEASDGQKVLITIEDSGTGISKTDLKRVFDPFFTTKPIGKGTGLGLSISYGIIREHGGNIRIRSEIGLGTQVDIELPVGDAVSTTPAQKKQRAVKISPKKFLVVEDEAEIVSLLQAGLSRNGSTVDAASNIEDALQLSVRRDYDFILADVKMPGGGIDFYKRLCAINPSYRGRVVLLTDASDPCTIQFLEREGLMCFSKPFDFDVMEKFFV